MPHKIHIEGREFFNDQTQEFIKVPAMDLVLEHSLISISKWEAKWHKPFLDDKNKKTQEELLDYFSYMCIKPAEVDPSIFMFLTNKQLNDLMEYIKNPMTATTFTIRDKKHNKEKITNELIYYWMAASQIPFDPCEKWHINRLLTLIQIAGIKNDPKASKKKMKRKEIIDENDRLNEMRKKQLNTKG